jgi:hypothetical protein
MPTVVYFLLAFIGLVVLIAQIRVFAIDATLKEILRELQVLRRVVESASSRGEAKP